VLHYLLDINCCVVVRVTVGRETWVVEATCGRFEVSKKTNIPIHQERLLGEGRDGQGRQSLPHQMSCRQGGREGTFEHA